MQHYSKLKTSSAAKSTVAFRRKASGSSGEVSEESRYCVKRSKFAGGRVLR